MSKTAEQILENYGTASLIGALRDDLPRKITQVKEIVRNHRDTYLQAEQGRQLLEAGLMTDIAAEIDPNTGKSAYSNEKTRAAELLNRKAKDEDYQLADDEAKKAKMNYEAVQDELDELLTRNRNYLAVVNLIAAELNLLANYYELPLEPILSAELSAQEVAADREEDY